MGSALSTPVRTALRCLLVSATAFGSCERRVRTWSMTVVAARGVAGCGVSAAGLVGLLLLMFVIFPPFLSQPSLSRPEETRTRARVRGGHPAGKDGNAPLFPV